MDASVTQQRFTAANRSTNRRSSDAGTGRRFGGLGWVQRRLTSSQ